MISLKVSMFQLKSPYLNAALDFYILSIKYA